MLDSSSVIKPINKFSTGNHAGFLPKYRCGAEEGRIEGFAGGTVGVVRHLGVFQEGDH